MDTFVEQIVPKQKGAKEFAVIGGCVFAALMMLLVLLPLLFEFIGMMGLFLVMGIFYGMWWLLSSLNREYEYSVTNGDIDVDEIIARRKRRRLVSVSGDKIESLEPFSEQAFAARPFDRRVIVAPSVKASDLWCFTYRSKKNGHTLVVFQPEQRVLNALIPGLSALVQRETKKKMVQ